MIDLPNAGPALIAPGWVAGASRALARIDTDRPEKAAMYLGDVETGVRPYAVVEGVAIVPVWGVIVPRLSWIGWEWATGCNVLRLQTEMAFSDPEVRGIAFHVNSGGGFASGVPDLADWIVEAKAAAGKPVAAILGEYAYSAAYWIASAADTIAVPRTGGVGSIGVLVVHWEFSGMLEREGVKATVIQAGARKAEGHPFAPLPEEVRDRWQAECEDLRGLFADTVARNRTAAGARLDTKAVLATEARTWEGPAGTAEAVAQGFADAVLPPDRALAGLIDHVSKDAT